jgi:hypothetical protein
MSPIELRVKTLFDSMMANTPLSIAINYATTYGSDRIVGTIHSIERESGCGTKFNVVLNRSNGTRVAMFLDCEDPSKSKLVQ